jgi:hypothetical protein
LLAMSLLRGPVGAEIVAKLATECPVLGIGGVTASAVVPSPMTSAALIPHTSSKRISAWYKAEQHLETPNQIPQTIPQRSATADRDRLAARS